MFQNRLVARITLIVALLAIAGGSLSAQDTPTDYARLIEEEVLTGYQELMAERLDADVQDLTYETWFIIAQAINKGYLRFTVDPENRSYIHGVQFLAGNAPEPSYIFISSELLSIWEQNKTLTYSQLSGAFREAYIYFRDTGAYRMAKNDAIESAFMRMERYAAEVAMIRDRLLPMGYLLSGYETYILDSFEMDGMVSGAMFLNGISLPVAQVLGEYRLVYEENRDDEPFRNSILKMGEDLLDARDNLPADAEDQQIFPLAVAIHSWLEMTPALIARIHNYNRSEAPLTFPEILEKEDEYTELRRLLEASRIRDMPIMEHIVRESIEGFTYKTES